MMDIYLHARSEDFNDENLQKLTRQISESINKHTQIKAVLNEVSQDNTKGDVITLGTIILTFVTGVGQLHW